MPRPSNTEERRQQIIAALLEVMAERGYERASVAEVAQRAGLAPGLVHYHFGDKQEILLGLIDALWSRAQERIAAAGAEESIDALIEALLGTGPKASLAEVRCWVAIAAEAIRQPAVGERYRAVLEALTSAAEVRVAATLRERSGSAHGAKRVAAALVAAIQGYFVVSAAAPALVPPGSAAGAVKQMAEGLLAQRSPR